MAQTIHIVYLQFLWRVRLSPLFLLNAAGTIGYDDTVGAKLKGEKKEIFYFIIIVKETIYYIHRILLNPLI